MNRYPALVLALLLALGLAGCTGEPEAKPPHEVPTPTTSPPASETSTTPSGPVEPTLPAAAEKNTKAGAEAFVRYFWEVVNYAQKTGDTKTLRTLALPSCGICTGGREWIDDVYSRGGRIVGGHNGIARMRTVTAPSGSWIINFDLHNTRQVVRKAGDLNKTYRAATTANTFVVRRVEGDLRVSVWEAA